MVKLLKKKLSEKQGMNRLNKYCDEMGYTDSCGFYNTEFKGDIISYPMENMSTGAKFVLNINLNTGDIWNGRF